MDEPSVQSRTSFEDVTMVRFEMADTVELSRDEMVEKQGGVIVIPVVVVLGWAGGALVAGATAGYYVVKEYYGERCEN